MNLQLITSFTYKFECFDYQFSKMLQQMKRIQEHHQTSEVVGSAASAVLQLRVSDELAVLA